MSKSWLDKEKTIRKYNLNGNTYMVINEYRTFWM